MLLLETLGITFQESRQIGGLTLIYTALTRGLEQLVLIGDRDAFDAAVMAPPHSR